MLNDRRVTVLGAGVAGLTVARALALKGAEVTVLEQAPEIREVGAGLQISPNGARVLSALGLGAALDGIGVAAERVADTVTLVCPASAEEIDAGLRRLRLWPLLAGWRGRARADTDAAVAAALALQAMMAGDPALAEVEINPLILRETGAVAVDAVIWEEM